jgi:aminoglycoside phosphotransferase
MSSFLIDDPKLPDLKQAVDDKRMYQIITATIGNGVYHRVRPEILKHKSGKHCVITYWLESSAAPSSRRIIGKVYRKDRGLKIFQKMLALWSASRVRDYAGHAFGMPEPLAYIPELGIVLQTAVNGRPFTHLSAWNELADGVRCVARNLSVLHGLPVTGLRKRTAIIEHIKKFCRPGPRALAETCLEMAPLVEQLVEGLQSDETLLNAPLCPAHGDLGLSQIFIDLDQAAFVDFDGCCLSHPALDVSNFMIALKVHYGEVSDDLQRVFLATYLKNHSSAMLAGLSVYHALIYLRRAMICFRHRSEPQWRRQAQQYLEIGIASLK